MSNTNRVTIRAAEETDFGIVQSTPSFVELCMTGAPGLAFSPKTEPSAKIRSDRQLDDLILVGGEAGGDINSELAYFLHDQFLEGALFSVFQTRVNRLNNEDETQITAVTAATDFTVTDETDTVIENDIMRGENFSVAANNAFHIVAAASTNTSFKTATAATEATPPNQARLTVVGHRSAGGDLDLTISGTTGTLGSTILDFLTVAALDLQAGDWICLDGFSATPANNGFYRLQLDPEDDTLTFDLVPLGAVTENPVGAVDIYVGDRLTNGTTAKSYSLEEEFADHTAEITYQYFRGMTIDKYMISAPSQSIVTTQVTFSGKDAFYSTTSAPASVAQLPGGTSNGRADNATTVLAQSANILNSSSNVARLSEDGVAITGANYVTEFTVEVANNLRQRNAVGFLGAISIGDGEFTVTGNMSTFFDNSDLARKVISNENTAVDVRYEDDDSHAIVIDLPKIKFSDGAAEVAAKNEDTTLPLTYTALRHAVFGYTMNYQRFGGFVKSA
jgi:hypothetical protein